MTARPTSSWAGSTSSDFDTGEEGDDARQAAQHFRQALVIDPSRGAEAIEHRREPVGRGLVRTHDPEAVGVGGDDVAQERTEHLRGLAGLDARAVHRDGVVMPLTWAGIGGYFALLYPMLVDAGWPVSRIGLVTTVLGGLFAIAGALAAGNVVSPIGRRRALLLFGIGQLAPYPVSTVSPSVTRRSWQHRR